MDSAAFDSKVTLPMSPTRESADVDLFLDQSAHSSLLRFSTAGSVDDGKSTLVGRLLHDTGNILDDHLAALHKRAAKEGGTALSLALVTDGLKSEREQGITIDVAYRYFSTQSGDSFWPTRRAMSSIRVIWRRGAQPLT